MAQQIYILTDIDNTSIAKDMNKELSFSRLIFSETFEITEATLKEMASTCMTEYFYVIKSDKELLFPKFNFTFKPELWDKEYMHVWNDNTIRLLNRAEVLNDPSKYADDSLSKGYVKIKDMKEDIVSYPLFDIVFLGYDESFIDKHYKALKDRFPRAKRVLGVKGIFEAHKAAANVVTTSMFYVVDADAIISDSFNFDHQPNGLERDTVHVWKSINPINRLEYGYGGVKLFPTKKLIEYNGLPIDFTTSVSKDFKVMDEVSNVTKFNTDPFSTWRSSFRECVKLASRMISNQDDSETDWRLKIWCTKGVDEEFGDFALMGANEGAVYGREHADQPELLGLINDFTWLENRFNS